MITSRPSGRLFLKEVDTLFNAHEFTFAGVSCLQYGLMIYDIGNNTQSAVSFGNTANIVEARTVNRIRPIHYGVNYHEDPLEFTLVFGSQEPLDRFEMEAISMWLTGHQQYQWLSIDQPDLDHVQFRCLCTELTPIFNGWLPVAFEAHFRCDCPYAYGHIFQKTYEINGETDIVFRNEGSAREYLRPTLTIITASGTTEFSIVNHSDGDRELAFTDLPAASSTIQMDNENGIVTELTGVDMYSRFNLNFFRLLPGDNSLTVTGNGEIVISGRFLHNVGG